MTASDPDDAPTRHGEPIPPQRPTGEERTTPAIDGKAASAPREAASASPARVPPAATDPLLGAVIGGCRIEALLGRGAMGAVYKARQTKLDRDVAVKVIRPEMMTDQRMLKRFEVEARTVGKFNSAHVVMVHDVGFERGVHYLVMEFVQGKNLRDHVKLLAGGRLPVGEALPLLRQAIKGLEEAQRLDVIHRDIKPDNLMITDRGVLKIADFGIAKPMQEDFSMTLTSELVGTPLYMSPEQCQGEAQLDFRSDMYSLGATFYYLLTGEPPIRASSVYELIQTKTKLAHLCLWKALPGLDENNPLSRVIERMTSLDREDRYDSYEALLNDLVLVEQGQTIAAPVAGAGGRGKPGRRSRALMFAAVLLALAGGGAFAASQLLPPPGPGAAEQLRTLRSQLVASGPSELLTKGLAAFVAPPELTKELAELRKDAAAAGALQKALAAVPPLAKAAMPFEDLRQHFAAVDDVAQKNPVPPVLAAWRDRVVAEARGTERLGAKARAELASTWARWQEARPQAAGVPARIADLGERLAQLETARTKLATALDDGKVEPTQEQIDVARKQLTANADRAAEVDLTEPLRLASEELERDGPSADLKLRVDAFKPTKPEQQRAHGQLVNAVGIADDARRQVGSNAAEYFPKDEVMRSDAGKYLASIATYWANLDKALEPVAQAAWAKKLRADSRKDEELRGKAVIACQEAFQQWRQRGAGPDAATGIEALRAVRQKASELFGAGAADAFATAIPEAALATATTQFAVAAKRQAWQASAEKLQKQLAGVSSLTQWSNSAAAVRDALAALDRTGAELAGDGEVAATRKGLDDGVERWTKAAARLLELDQDLAAGKLKAAGVLARGAVGNEGKPEFEIANQTVLACESAFDGLGKTLAIDAAETALQTARERLRASGCLPQAEQRLATWLQALAALRDATRGMVAIPGGKTKAGDAVEPFFLAATECSRAEFSTFVDAVAAAVKGVDDAQQRFDRVQARFAGAGMTPKRLTDLLLYERRDDKQPADKLSWFAAAAFASWHGRALPTPAEWTLAAFGDGGTNEYPWGRDWVTNDPAKRNPSNEQLAAVDAGGLSWRSAGDVRLHHLAGNVAEWLAADPAQPNALLAGGRFNDPEARSRERAAGKFAEAAKDEALRGFGFRTVLRVRSFPGLDWPK